MTSSGDLRTSVAIWLVVALFLVWRHWRRGQGVGLVLGYVVSFGAIHWLAAALYLLPWHSHRGEAIVAEGMRQSGWGMLAFAFGAEIAMRFIARKRAAPSEAADNPNMIWPSVVNLYLAAGAVLYGILFPMAQGIPTVGALVATGSTVFVVGIGLKCWNAWLDGNRRTVLLWLAASSVLPFFTVATLGFLGYGMAAMMIVWAFAAAIVGPRWKGVAAGLVLGYLGLSVYVTYMRDRGDIRDVVWGGSDLSERVGRVAQTLKEMEWFDLNDDQHLERIDSRLNQNFLVGLAVFRIDSGAVPFAQGATVIDAALGIVPRALWSEKPTAAGSGDLVSFYTGLQFAEGTSVGIGQVMELYVNFATFGVVAGFLVIGAFLGGADRLALRALQRGDAGAFSLWYLPSLCLLQLGGSFVEVTSSAGSAVVMALGLAYLFRRTNRAFAEAAGMPIRVPGRPPVWP